MVDALGLVPIFSPFFFFLGGGIESMGVLSSQCFAFLVVPIIMAVHLFIPVTMCLSAVQMLYACSSIFNACFYITAHLVLCFVGNHEEVLSYQEPL